MTTEGLNEDTLRGYDALADGDPPRLRDDVQLRVARDLEEAALELVGPDGVRVDEWLHPREWWVERRPIDEPILQQPGFAPGHPHEAYLARQQEQGPDHVP